MGINSRLLSKQAYQRASGVIQGGVDSPVRALKSVGTTPLFIKSANGAYVTDIDGNTFVDFCMSWGVFILGHNNKHVTAKAVEAIYRGSSYGIPSENETVLAEKVRRAIPSMERLRFVNSGTEATMSAIRVARGYTGRDILVKFEGNYHGHADHLLVSAGSGVAGIAESTSAGVPSDFTKKTVCLPYNDANALQSFFSARGNDVAAVIIEPVACNMGVVVPDMEFLKTVRQLTSDYGVVLIFDEVITGFRLSEGGAQRLFGITPDMTCVGKIVGGGFPAAAFGGKAEIMSVLAPDGPVYQAGTLSGNPVAMAAGSETLQLLSEPNFYQDLEQRSSNFLNEVEEIIKGKDIQLNRCGSMFTLFFSDMPVRNFAHAQNCNQKHFAKYFRNMLERGVYVSPSQFEGNFISICHTEKILEKVLLAMKKSIEI